MPSSPPPPLVLAVAASVSDMLLGFAEQETITLSSSSTLGCLRKREEKIKGMVSQHVIRHSNSVCSDGRYRPLAVSSIYCLILCNKIEGEHSLLGKVGGGGGGEREKARRGNNYFY